MRVREPYRQGNAFGIPHTILYPQGPQMQYLTAFGALKGPNGNTLQHAAPSRPPHAIPNNIWSPQGPNMRYLTPFLPSRHQNAIPCSIWGPQGPKLQYLIACLPSRPPNVVPCSMWALQGPGLEEPLFLFMPFYFLLSSLLFYTPAPLAHTRRCCDEGI